MQQLLIAQLLAAAEREVALQEGPPLGGLPVELLEQLIRLLQQVAAAQGACRAAGSAPIGARRSTPR